MRKVTGLFLIITLCGGVAFAQQGNRNGKDRLEKAVEKRNDKMIADLKLDDKQAAEFKAINEKYVQKVEKEREATKAEREKLTEQVKADREKQVAKFKALNDDRNAEMKKIMTDEQYQQFIAKQQAQVQRKDQQRNKNQQRDKRRS